MPLSMLLQMSAQAALMVVAIVVLRALLLNRLPKKAFLLLWALVALRLLVPVSVPSPVSVYGLVELLAPAAAQQAAGATAAGADANTDVAGISPTGSAGTTLPTGGAGDLATVSSPSAAAAAPASGADTPTDPLAALTGAALGGVPVWRIVWTAGILACLAFFLISYIRCRREFRSSLPVDNALVAAWLEAHQLRRPIDIRQTDRISAPLTYGVFRPVILVPATMDWDDADTLRYVLEHEFTHIRRFDAASKLALAATVCIHWFNPLAWAMYVLANRDLELACDETVVRGFGRTSRGAYARTLIKMEETRSVRAPLCNSFGTTAIEERIVAIMNIRKTSAAALLASAALVVGVPAALATTSAWDTGDGNVVISTDADQGETANEAGDGALPSSADEGATGTPVAESASDSAGDGVDTTDYTALAPYGLERDAATGSLRYNGETVRYFWDGVDYGDGTYATFSLYCNTAGTVDVGTVRTAPRGTAVSDPTQTELVGVQELTPAQAAYVADAVDGGTGAAENPAADTRSAATADGAAEAGAGDATRVTYRTSGSADVAEEDAVAVVDYYLTTGPSDEAVEEYAADDATTFENAADGGAASTGDDASADATESGVDDGTIAARLAPFARYGVTYEPAADGGMGNVYYNGALVRTFVDYNEANGALFAFNSDDADPGDANLRVEHDADGTVTGVRAFTGEVSF